MARLLPRILFHAGLTAGVLAGLGFLAAEAARGWLGGHAGAGADGQAWADGVAATLRAKLPLAMAAWGFGLVVVGEGLRAVWRPAAAGKRPAGGPVGATDSEVERLLTDLLSRAEADAAARPARSGQGASGASR